MGTFVAAASLFLTAYSGVKQAQAAENAAEAQAAQNEYNEAVAKNNAIIADRAARDAKSRGDYEAQQADYGARQRLATLRASAASRGVEVGSGSAQDLEADSAAQNAANKMVIRSNAEREAAGYRNDRDTFIRDAGLSKVAAKNALIEGKTNRNAILVNTGAEVASKWYTYNRGT